MKRQGKEWPKNVYARAKEFCVTESTSKNDVIQRVWKKNRNFTKFSSQAISRLRGSDRVSRIFTFATNTGGTRIRNKRLYEIQVANQLWKAALKTSLRLFSDIFCQSGHSLCRIRQRTCPEDRVIVLCYPVLVTIFSKESKPFLNEEP